MTAPVKEFVMKHDFKDVPNFEEGVYQFSPTEEHFNIPWSLAAIRLEGFLGCHLYCDQAETNKFSIHTHISIRLVTVTGKQNKKRISSTYDTENDSRGFFEFLDWKKMEKDYMIDDHITIECHVEIFEMSGIEKKKLKNFDATMEEFSDLVIIVEDEKFYVSKLFLADQSKYFKSFLTKKQEQSGKPEIELDDCKSENFQYFLELIYGESPIDDETVDGIIHLADKYQAPTAMRKCEEFLINNFGKSLKEKLQMAKTYKLDNLKDRALSEIKNVADIRSVLSYDVNEMDPSVVAALLQKALSYLP